MSSEWGIHSRERILYPTRWNKEVPRSRDPGGRNRSIEGREVGPPRVRRSRSATTNVETTRGGMIRTNLANASTRSDGRIAKEGTLRRGKGRFVPKGKVARPRASSDDGEGPARSFDAEVPRVELRRARDMESASAFSGISSVDRGDDPVEVLKRIAVLVSCDVGSLLLFSSVGRSTHHSADGSLFGTAAPFLIAWFVVGTYTEAYGEDARGGDVGAAASVAGKTWAMATPAGILLRAVGKGRLPPKPFVIVAMIVTGILLVGSRAALAWKTKEQPRSRKEVIKSRKNKRANPLEIFSLIGGLTKRW